MLNHAFIFLDIQGLVPQLQGGTIKLANTPQRRLCRSRSAWLGILGAAVLSVCYAPASSLSQPYQGFGAGTRGGADYPVYHVTNLNDAGTGSLREALSQGNRSIAFDVGGEILLNSDLAVRGPFVTIDGFSAPAPGITLKNYGLSISGERGAHDVIVRGIRVRAAAVDGINVIKGAYNVLIDHVSIHGSADGNLDIGTSAHDVTVSWSILSGIHTNMLIKYDPSRVTLHHNIYMKAPQRSPHVAIDNVSTPATDTTVDMRNNLVWNWGGGSGTVIGFGAWANVVDNFYGAAGGDKQDALLVNNGGRAYVADNISAEGININARGTEAIPFPAPVVDTVDACTAAHEALAGAGASPLDAVDHQSLSEILLPCAGIPEITSPTPGSVLPGSEVTFIWAVYGANVKDWRLYVGTTQGAKNLHDSSNLNASKTSRTVRNLPTDGRVIWVQLRFHIDGVWYFADYQYTAALR